ncbi:MAG: hypothetical protein GY771_15990 [bacterium]|nr:hypothetical protein [bacterium]
MKPDDFTALVFMGIVFGGGIILGYKLMEALEENGYLDLKKLGLSDE